MWQSKATEPGVPSFVPAQVGVCERLLERTWNDVLWLAKFDKKITSNAPQILLKIQDGFKEELCTIASRLLMTPWCTLIVSSVETVNWQDLHKSAANLFIRARGSLDLTVENRVRHL